MTVSIERTTRKYRGRVAATYEEKRKKQRRWDLENDAVSAMLRGRGGTVLDVPFGTGRFVEMYRAQRMSVVGVDASEEMLALARKKIKKSDDVDLYCEDVLSFLARIGDRCYESVVCVRFLDLIDEKAMRAVVTELCRVARDRIVLTIRLGDRYAPKVNTATHDEKRLRRLIGERGWRIAEDVPVFRAGWRVMRLERK